MASCINGAGQKETLTKFNQCLPDCEPSGLSLHLAHAIPVDEIPALNTVQQAMADADAAVPIVSDGTVTKASDDKKAQGSVHVEAINTVGAIPAADLARCDASGGFNTHLVVAGHTVTDDAIDDDKENVIAANVLMAKPVQMSQAFAGLGRKERKGLGARAGGMLEERAFDSSVIWMPEYA